MFEQLKQDLVDTQKRTKVTTDAATVHVLLERHDKLVRENEQLQKCCTQRGARMQKIYKVLRSCITRETISISECNEIVGWFDADGVPK